LIYVAWWTGRGFYTFPIVIASMIIAEILRAALRLPEGLWVFAIALFVAAAANWQIGRKLNRNSLRKVRTTRLKERLLYRARHKFMSLPMETFSIVLAVAGAAILVGAALQNSSGIS
jgi:uncharacterized membrane protein